MYTVSKFCSVLLAGLLLLCIVDVAVAQEKEGGTTDWGVVERLRGTDSTTVVSEEKETGNVDEAGEKEVNYGNDALHAEPFQEDNEELDHGPIVESVTKKTVEELGRKLVGGTEHICLRCEKQYQISAHVLGIKTLVGVSGISLTWHAMSRTSLQAGIGYGLGGFNFGAAMLHYFSEESSLHLLSGINVSMRRKSDERDFEGVWMLVGLGSSYTTQLGVGYGLDFGLTMAIAENAFRNKMRLCFGVLSQSSCQERWRIVPYIGPIRISYSL